MARRAHRRDEDVVLWRSPATNLVLKAVDGHHSSDAMPARRGECTNEVVERTRVSLLKQARVAAPAVELSVRQSLERHKQI